MEIFNIVVGIFSILSFFVSLYAVSEVIKIKKKINVTSHVAGSVTQTATGDGNQQAGGNISNA